MYLEGDNMINFLIECSMCKDNALLSVIYIVRKVMEVIFIIVPIILIVLVTIDIAKNVVAAKEEDMKKNRNIAIKRIIYAIAIFFVPAIVNLIMNTIYRTVDDSSEQSFFACWDHATLDNVKQCNEEAIENAKEIDNEKKQKSDSIINEYESKVDEQNKSREKGVTKGEDKVDNNSSNSNIDNNNSGGLTQEEKAKAYIIWVGDSRTNGMCSAVAINDGKANNEVCIAKDGAGIYWLKNTTTKAKIYSALNLKPNAYVIINLGVNGITGLSKSSIENLVSSYVDIYKEFMDKYPNAHFIITSVGLVDEGKEASYDEYKVSNINVNDFNTAMANALQGIKIDFCNTNSTVGNYETSKDGLHYTNDTYKKVYEASKSCF